MESILRLLVYFVLGSLVLRLVLSFKSLLFFLTRCWRCLEERTQAYQSFEIPRFGDAANENPLYRKSLAYIKSLPSLEDCDGVQVFSSGRKSNDFFFQSGVGRGVHDSFIGARVLWTHFNSEPSERAKLVLKLRRQDARRVLRPYLQHVEAVADDLDLRRRELRIFTHRHQKWCSTPLTHPSTLDTVAMDADAKTRVRADLESFLKGRAFYHRIGRPWRRSYLLYGPPGTGKSTFAAAMAKFLCYDLYELDLSRAADLRALLLQTTPRSLILFEDLDRYLYEDTSEKRLTEILSVMDGVLTSCIEERVMVFTVGSKEGLESAVLRPGRIDVQLSFSLCNFSAFKDLASSYLGLKDHKLFPQVEEGFMGGAKVSPAEVSEIMIANRGSPSRALKSVISALQQSSSNELRTKDDSAMSFDGGSTELNGSAAWSGRGVMGLDRSATVREFRKLYGLIRRSRSKRDGVLPVELAAAAAAAGGGHGDVDADTKVGFNFPPVRD